MQVSSYTFQTPYSQPLQIGRPDASMLKAQSETANEQLEKTKKSATELIDTKSKQDKAEMYTKSSVIYQNDPTYGSAALAVKEYMTLSKDAQRSENFNTYVSNGNDFSAPVKVDMQSV